MPSLEQVNVFYTPDNSTAGSPSSSEKLKEDFLSQESIFEIEHSQPEQSVVEGQESFIPLKDAAAQLGISDKQLRRYLTSGEVRFELRTKEVVRVISQLYVSVEDAMKYREGHPTGVNKRWSTKESSRD